MYLLDFILNWIILSETRIDASAPIVVFVSKTALVNKVRKLTVLIVCHVTLSFAVGEDILHLSGLLIGSLHPSAVLRNEALRVCLMYTLIGCLPRIRFFQEIHGG